jgi:hypothetical protein
MADTGGVPEEAVRRRLREAETVRLMIRLYCKGHHGNSPLCAACEEMLAYAHEKAECCPHGDEKPTCRRCTIHCYDAEHRDRIREVMRYAAPRILLHHPVLAMRHRFR